MRRLGGLWEPETGPSWLLRVCVGHFSRLWQPRKFQRSRPGPVDHGGPAFLFLRAPGYLRGPHA